MPIINVQLTAGYSSAQKTTLLKTATQAAVDSLAAPIGALRLTLEEVAPEHIMVAGVGGTQIVHFNVQMIVGRTEEKKAALIAALSKAAHDVTGISEQEVRVIIRDVPTTNMGMAGGVSAKSTGR